MTTPNKKAQQGFDMLKDAVVEFLQNHEHGAGNSEIARALGIESDFEGNQKNYLSWSVLGMLVDGKRVRYEMINNRRRYFAENVD